MVAQDARFIQVQALVRGNTLRPVCRISYSSAQRLGWWIENLISGIRCDRMQKARVSGVYLWERDYPCLPYICEEQGYMRVLVDYDEES